MTNITNWIFLFLGAILAYLLEFTRPWVKSYFENRSLSIRERKIKALIARYIYVKSTSEHPQFLSFAAFNALAMAMIFLILLVGLGFVLTLISISPLLNGQTQLSIILLSGSGILYSLTRAISYMKELVDVISDVLQFEKYREKTIKKLKKLGGNPEDLDKEEG